MTGKTRAWGESVRRHVVLLAGSACILAALFLGFNTQVRRALPTRLPQHTGTVEDFSGDPRNGTLLLRTEPAPPAEGPESTESKRKRELNGLIVIKIVPTTVVNGDTPERFRFGQRVKVWSDGPVATTMPPTRRADFVEYDP
jgi:hypothetical protein